MRKSRDRPLEANPLDRTMTFDDMRRALDRTSGAPAVISARLPGTLMGVYDDEENAVLLDPRLSDVQRRCTLMHEIVHWSHRDSHCEGYDGRMERRARRETAWRLISMGEYARAERVYDGDPYNMACALGVTVQVLEDYRREFLADRVHVPVSADF